MYEAAAVTALDQRRPVRFTREAAGGQGVVRDAEGGRAAAVARVREEGEASRPLELSLQQT